MIVPEVTLKTIAMKICQFSVGDFSRKLLTNLFDKWKRISKMVKRIGCFKQYL